jgi:hypothetical protein
MKTGYRFLLLVAILFMVVLTAWRVPFQETQEQQEVQEQTVTIQKGAEFSPYSEENESCLICHGEQRYLLTDPSTGLSKRRHMAADYYVDRDEFYSSVHWSFSCLDCHPAGYSEFPHAIELRFEAPWACLDCHGYDETYARYKFEDIDTEHMKSVHYTATDGEFSCWNCHDPHSYQTLAREGLNMADVVRNSNNMCLVCHGDPLKFGLITDKEPTDVLETHSWLPNQRAHLQAVRCIDCHTTINDSLLISHNLTPADKAVKGCVECHSSNSILMGTLYKHQVRETRSEYGFINAAIINNQSYVVGANRSKFMNIGSLLIFGLTLGVVLVHSLVRLLNSKKSHHE